MRRNTKWSSLLVKDHISQELVAAVAMAAGSKCAASLRSMIASDKRNLAALRKAVLACRSQVPVELWSQLSAELREIVADSKWLATRRGKYILTVNTWAETFHHELRGNPAFADVLVGCHSSRQAVFVTGSVKNRQTLERLLGFLYSKKPPFKMLISVNIDQRGATVD